MIPGKLRPDWLVKDAERFWNQRARTRIVKSEFQIKIFSEGDILVRVDMSPSFFYNNFLLSARALLAAEGHQHPRRRLSWGGLYIHPPDAVKSAGYGQDEEPLCLGYRQHQVKRTTFIQKSPGSFQQVSLG